MSIKDNGICLHCGFRDNSLCTNHRRKDGSYPLEPNPPSRDEALSAYIFELEQQLAASHKMTQGFTDLEAARSDAKDELMEEVIDRLKEIYLR